MATATSAGASSPMSPASPALPTLSMEDRQQKREEKVPASPIDSILSSFQRGRRSRQASANEKIPTRKSTAMSTLSSAPSTSSHVMPGATLFNTQGKPELQMMESYAVARQGSFNKPGRSASFNRRKSMHSRNGSRSRSRLRRSTIEEDEEHSVSIDQIGPPQITDQAVLRVDDSGLPPNDVRLPDLAPLGPGYVASTSLHSAAQDQRLAELHARNPFLRNLPTPLLPIVPFPDQGTGRSSEFNQDAPIWAQQPYKLVYFTYFGLSVGLVFLPWFAAASLLPSNRERPSWTWKKSTLVKLYRHGTRLTFRTHTSLSRDLTKEVPHSQTVRAKFVWVEALAEKYLRGEIRRALDVQGLSSVRTCGFWYGERDGGGGVGQKAVPGEKVVYHLHGGAYWIGTAHEKDVTAAVNIQVLKALDSIYTSRLPKPSDGRTSPHPPNGTPSAGPGNRGLCKRAFSLDYRLCVPGRPEIGSFPAPLVDALAGYWYLVQECNFDPNNIIIVGDSAGGNLALALCRYLRDEAIKEMPMPGAMILLSPWADASRSHSGPTSAPNKFSTVYTNRKTDIIASSTAFRNTAVSALLGKLPARETYRNPYLSSISLQLSAKKGGVGPHWGFEGFPRRIYICTGTAEISHDQHLTLAYRLAAGTQNRVPILSGDKCSANADPYEMAARLHYPRPGNHKLAMWPSAQNTPAIETAMAPQNQLDNPAAPLRALSERLDSSNNIAATAIDAALEKIRMANGYLPNLANLRRDTDNEPASQPRTASHAPEVGGALDRQVSPYGGGQAGTGPNTTKTVKQKDTAHHASSTHDEGAPAKTAKLTNENGQAVRLLASQASSSSVDSFVPPPSGDVSSRAGPEKQNESSSSASYFNVGGEDRTVVLDECIDGIHDYTLFDWFEPERGQAWARIASWIDKEI